MLKPACLAETCCFQIAITDYQYSQEIDLHVDKLHVSGAGLLQSAIYPVCKAQPFFFCLIMMMMMMISITIIIIIIRRTEKCSYPACKNRQFFTVCAGSPPPDSPASGRYWTCRKLGEERGGGPGAAIDLSY